MSATTVGQIGLDLVVNRKKFDQQMNGIGKVAKKVGAALASAFAVKKIVDFGKECVNLASDLEEVQNVVDVTFPSMTTQVDKFAKNAASAFGLSETMAKKYTGTFGAMAKAFGFSEQQAYDMSTTLTGLAGDVASFYNLTQDEAYTKLKSVFTGETESLKELGVVMTQTALDSYALSNGYGKTTSAMSEAEKVALRYAFVQDQLAAASGDFIRTSGSWANQVRILSLQFDNLKTSIGSGLIAAFTPVLQMINTLLAKLQVLADAFKSFMTGIFGDAGGMESVSAAAGSAAASSGEIASNTAAAADSAKKASKYLAGFDEIIKVSSPESGGSGGSGSGGSGSASIGSSSGAKGGNEEAKGASKLLEEFAKIDLSPLKTSLDGLYESVSRFGSDVFSGLSWGYENILKPLAVWAITDLAPAFFNALGSAIDFCSTVLEETAPYFNSFYETVMKPLAEFVGDAIVRFWEDVGYAFDFFSQVLQDNPAIAEIIAAIAAALGTFAAAMGIVNLVTAMNPFGLIALAVSSLIVVIGELVRNWETIETTVVGVWDAVKTAWNEAGVWFETNVVAPISEFFSGLWLGACNAASGAWAFIKTAWNNVGTWFKTKVIDPVSKFFSGLWTGISTTASRCWNGILNLFSSGGKIFSGIKDGIASVFKTIVNSLISGINRVIASPFNTINGLLNRIRNTSVLGFKPFSGLWSYNPLPVPQIPMLAQGGYVKPNTPQLAMIGDNRHQGEVVAPEDKLLEMAIKAAKMAGGGDPEVLALLKEIIALLKELLDDPNDTVLYIGDEEIARANNRGSSKLKRRYATTKVQVGD